MFDGKNPTFVVYPYPVDNATFEVKNVPQLSTIPQNAVILSIYPKDDERTVFIEQIIKLRKDNPGKYIRGFVETIDHNAKVWYILSDTPDGKDTA